MKSIAIIFAALAMAGCGRSSPDLESADNRVVCSLAGEALFVRPGVGDVSFIKRQPDSDPLCARMKP